MVLHYYGITDVGENELVEETDARYYDKPIKDGSYGTTTVAMAKPLTSRGFILSGLIITYCQKMKKFSNM